MKQIIKTAAGPISVEIKGGTFAQRILIADMLVVDGVKYDEKYLVEGMLAKLKGKLAEDCPYEYENVKGYSWIKGYATAGGTI